MTRRLPLHLPAIAAALSAGAPGLPAQAASPALTPLVGTWVGTAAHNGQQTTVALALVPGVPEGPGNLLNHPHHVAGGERPRAPHAGAQRLTIHEPHDEEDVSPEFLDTVDRDEVRVREARGRTRLTQKPRAYPVERGEVGGEGA